MNSRHCVIRSSCCDADDKRWVQACRDRRIECPIKTSNCPTNAGFNDISQLILLTDGLIAHKINLRDKSSHRCTEWAIKQSYFGGYEWNSIWVGGGEAGTYKQSKCNAAASRVLADRVEVPASMRHPSLNVHGLSEDTLIYVT